MSTAAQILKEARAVLAAGEVDTSISKADTIAALAALLAQVDMPGDASAFPTAAHIGDMGVTEGGLTVRQYYAARAPITVEEAMLAVGATSSNLGMLSCDERKCVMAGLAQLRFDYADAMVRESAE